MFSVPILPVTTGIQLIQLCTQGNDVVAVMTTTPYAARCPQCNQLSRHVHSHYVRRLTELPWGRVVVRIELHTRRFFCRTLGCLRWVFTERIPGLTAPYGRRTHALTETLHLVALAAGGEGGSRLADALRMGTSPDTLLRLLRRGGLPARTSPRVIGVDDWAYRKGKRYGTLVIDLESHRPIDLLPDRTAESWAAWLQDHPSVEIVSRDRGDIYAHGTTLGAPHARQVADRWHLHHNLVEAVQRVVERHHGQLRTIAKQHIGAAVQAVAASAIAPDVSARLYKVQTIEERRRGERDQRYRERYEQTHTLRQQGLSISAVARLMGLNRRTVTTLLAAESYPGIPTRGLTARAVAGFEAYLRQRWYAGMHNVMTLLSEIRTQGYRGTYSSLWSYLRSLVAGTTVSADALAPHMPIKSAAPSPRAATWWLFGKTERLTMEQQTWLQQWLLDCSQIDATRRLALRFSDVLHGRSSDSLRQWLIDAEDSGIVDLQRFTASLRTDYAAVEAGITEPWSNGMTEGHVNRLKLLKRQMYGRAKFDLLRIRVLNQV